MGVFTVQISIADTQRKEWVDLFATVDTGTFMSAVPSSILKSLGVTPILNQTGQLADGTEKNVDVAYTWLRLNQREIMTHIIFNEEYTSPLLGSLALEELLLTVDPSGKRLIPLTHIPF